MNKKIIFAIILTLFIIGCGRTPSLEPEVIEYHKGFDGLEITSVKNLPPNEILKGTEFVIGLELRNKGAYDIEDGLIMIYGFPKGYALITRPEFYFDIEGKQPGFPEGGYGIINFNIKGADLPERMKEYPAAYTIKANYRYQTEAGTEVCINPFVYSYMKTKETVCEPKEVVLKKGQGAPVAVTRVQQSFAPIGNKIQVTFIINIENKGDGKVIDKVYLDEVRLANVPLSCEPQEITLKEKEESSIICTTETLVSSGAYISPLSVKFNYIYSQVLDKKLTIKSLT
ncbi:MAG: hypothetical protein V3V78_02710 [Candidatus Woesearchaeota archaeon]